MFLLEREAAREVLFKQVENLNMKEVWAKNRSFTQDDRKTPEAITTLRYRLRTF